MPTSDEPSEPFELPYEYKEFIPRRGLTYYVKHPFDDNDLQRYRNRLIRFDGRLWRIFGTEFYPNNKSSRLGELVGLLVKEANEPF